MSDKEKGGNVMSKTTGILVGALIAVNVALVGLLLFRDRSIAPAQAESSAATAVLPVAGQQLATTGSQPESEAAASAAKNETKEAPASAYAPETESSKPVEASPSSKTREEPPAAPARTETQTRREPVRVASRGREPEPLPRRETRATEQRVETKPAPPRRVTVTVPAGTLIPIQLDVALHSRQVKNGDSFEARLARDVVVDGRTLAEAGSPVTGQVLEVEEAGKSKGVEKMTLTLSNVTLVGRSYRTEASTVHLEGEKETDKDAAIVGGSAVAGAIIGAIAKGGKGAAVGAATGAAAGAGVVLSTRGKPIALSAGSRLDFTLESPIRVSLPASMTLPEARPAPEEPEEEPGVARR